MTSSYQPREKSTPAELHAFLDGDRGHAGDGMIGHELLAGVDALRLLAGLDELRDRLDAVARHQQRILLRSRADNTLLDALDAVAAAIDGDHEHALFLAGRLQRGIAAVRRRLVDRVDEVDVIGLLEDLLHRRAAALVRTRGKVGTDDLWTVAGREVLGILDRARGGGEEPVVAQGVT